MSDYISREAAKELLKRVIFGADIKIDKWMDSIPAADVRPVVRGEWKKAYADHEAFGVRPFYRYCSKCHEASVHQYNFCPNCGADTRKALEEGKHYAE